MQNPGHILLGEGGDVTVQLINLYMIPFDVLVFSAPFMVFYCMHVLGCKAFGWSDVL